MKNYALDQPKRPLSSYRPEKEVIILAIISLSSKKSKLATLIMDFRLKKLHLASSLMAIGMVVALAWYNWNGIILGMGYPHNTIFVRSDWRFTDFQNDVYYSSLPNPYNFPPGRYVNYLPCTYSLYYPLSCMPHCVAFLLFFSSSIIFIFNMTSFALRPLLPNKALRLVYVLMFLLASYPFLFCLDRGNAEILVVQFIAAFILFYGLRKYRLSLVFLTCAICMKGYPIIFLPLFYRSRKIHLFFIGIAGFISATIASLLTFHDSIWKSWTMLTTKVTEYNEGWGLGDQGLATSANIWNLCKVFLSFFFYHSTWPVPKHVLIEAMKLHWIFMSLLGLAVIFHVIFVEKEFLRRAVVLLLYMTISVPGGADYKLLHAQTALVALILIPRARSFDLPVVGLIAFSLVAKREFYINFIGPTNTGFRDTSFDIILNPLAILLALFLLILNSFQLTSMTWVKLRVLRFLRSFRSLSRLHRARSICHPSFLP